MTASRASGPARMAMLVILCWSVAAVLVAAIHGGIRENPAIELLLAVSVVMITSYLYNRIAERQKGRPHALLVGISWFLLSIVTELIVASQIGHGWFVLLGSPDHELTRTAAMLAWLFAPAVFARRGSRRGRISN